MLHLFTNLALATALAALTVECVGVIAVRLLAPLFARIMIEGTWRRR